MTTASHPLSRSDPALWDADQYRLSLPAASRSVSVHPDRFIIDWYGEGEALYFHTDTRNSSGHTSQRETRFTHDTWRISDLNKQKGLRWVKNVPVWN